MSLESGASVGPYEIVAPIGAGGMGEVYRAHDRKLGRDIALKVLSAELSSSAEHLRRFEQEARAASALNHPNIVTIHDVGQSAGVSYIAMELIEGQDLRGLTARGPLPLKQLMRIATKVAEGLAAAHERGIVHRDLKPENIIVSHDGFVKIVDFGLAKLVRPFGLDDSTLPHTTPGAIFGTLGYMSPEQVSGRATDFRSDQFSFGVILYELLTMRRPFDRDSGSETLAAILRDEPRPLTDFNEAVPPELVRVVERCLAKEPRDRYAATPDLARDLREIRDTLSNASSGRRSTPPAARRPRRLAPLIASSVAAAVMIGAIYLASHERSTSARPQQAALTSIAVMPFRNLGGSSTTRSFVDGLAETITARLAQNPTLRVSMPFDGPPLADGTPIPEVARRRKADVVLRCSVQESGADVRATYALFEGRSGRQLATDVITGKAADLFTFEDSVAERILRTLRAPVPPPQPAQAASLVPPLSRPEDQKLYLEAVGLLQQTRDEKAVDGAIERLEHLLLNARDSVNVNCILARAYVAKYRLSHRASAVDQAAVYADRAVQLDPSSPQAHVAAGQVALVNGRYPSAVGEFQRALATQPKLFDATLGLAQAYDKMGRAADAEQKFATAIALRPDHYSAFNTYGAFALSHGQSGKAIELFEEVIRLAPDMPRGYTNLGGAYQAAGRYDDAVQAYRRSIALQPTSAAYSNLGSYQYSQGHYGEACASFEEATRLTPTNYLLWLNLGDAYRWTSGQRQKATAAYQRAISLAGEEARLNPQNALARASAASAFAKLGDVASAQREIDAAVRLDPTDKDVLYQAAVVAALRGENDRAIDWLGRAIAAGYGPSDARLDPELTPLRKDPAFAQALQGKQST